MEYFYHKTQLWGKIRHNFVDLMALFDMRVFYTSRSCSLLFSLSTSFASLTPFFSDSSSKVDKLSSSVYEETNRFIKRKQREILYLALYCIFVCSHHFMTHLLLKTDLEFM